MANIVEMLEKKQERFDLPMFRAGDTLRIHFRIKEGTRERVQAFEGVCIAKNSEGCRSTITIRKISFGHGVERIFPLSSPRIEKIEILSFGKVRRAKLYYLRKLRGKKARIKERRIYKTKI